MNSFGKANIRFFAFLLFLLLSITAPAFSEQCGETLEIELDKFYTEIVEPKEGDSTDYRRYKQFSIPYDGEIKIHISHTGLPNPCHLNWILYEEGGNCDSQKEHDLVLRSEDEVSDSISVTSGVYILLFQHVDDSVTGKSYFDFKVEYTSGCTIPVKTTQPNPSNNENDTGLIDEICWTGDSNAVSYDVYFDDSPTLSDSDFEETVTETCYSIDDLEEGKTYYWRIDAENECGVTLGDEWNFSTGFCPTEKPKDLSPNTLISEYTPEFTWTGVSDAKKYYISCINMDSDQPAFTDETEDTNFRPANNLDIGNYKWAISATKPGCDNQVSDWVWFGILPEEDTCNTALIFSDIDWNKCDWAWNDGLFNKNVLEDLNTVKLRVTKTTGVGSKLQSKNDYHFGEYRVRAQLAPESYGNESICQGIFYYLKDHGEIDIELRTNLPEQVDFSIHWTDSSGNNQWETISKSIAHLDRTKPITFGFNWYNDRVDFVVGSHIISSTNDPEWKDLDVPIPSLPGKFILQNFTGSEYSGDAPTDKDRDFIIESVSYVPFSNSDPQTPTLLDPSDGREDVNLSPLLVASQFIDTDENDTHSISQWQISSDSNFTNLIFDTQSSDSLEEIQVPDLLLSLDTTYFWRVKYFDNRGGESEWASASRFKTKTVSSEDGNYNGIPDDQEVDEETDLDNDGQKDLYQSDIKSFNTVTGDWKVGIKIVENSNNVYQVKSVGHENINDDNIPSNLPLGLVCLRMDVVDSDQPVKLQVYLSKPVPEGAKLYKYDFEHGFYDFTEHTLINPDRDMVIIELFDGGLGDIDGLKNGIIIDPLGMVTQSSSTGSSAASSSGGGGCYIATAAFGSPINKYVGILKEFRDQILLHSAIGKSFISVYYKKSPKAAQVIYNHESLRALARISLLPVIGFSWMSLQIGLFNTMILVLITFFAVYKLMFLRKRAKL